MLRTVNVAPQQNTQPDHPELHLYLADGKRDSALVASPTQVTPLNGSADIDISRDEGKWSGLSTKTNLEQRTRV